MKVPQGTYDVTGVLCSTMWEFLLVPFYQVCLRLKTFQFHVSDYLLINVMKMDFNKNGYNKKG